MHRATVIASESALEEAQLLCLWCTPFATPNNSGLWQSLHMSMWFMLMHVFDRVAHNLAVYYN